MERYFMLFGIINGCFLQRFMSLITVKKPTNEVKPLEKDVSQ